MTTGTEGNDDLTNNRGNPFDQVDALGGDDIITVQIPIDSPSHTTVDGGAGFDILYLTTRDISGTGVTDSINIREGLTLYGTVTWTNIERFVLSTPTRGVFSGTEPLVFGAAEDWLTMGRNDNLPYKFITGAGNDRVILNALQVGAEIDLGDGDDLVDFSGAAPTLNAVFSVEGGDGNDSLTGSSYRDEFFGGEGDDFLDGRGTSPSQGADLLVGGTGSDDYYVEAGTSIVELAGEGFDEAYSRTNYGLAAGVSVELLGTIDYRLTDPLTLVGNELNNAVTGNNGNNALYGGDGDDSIRGLAGNDVMNGQGGTDYLIGGAGDDIYFVDGLDTAVEAAGEGYDTIYASTSYTLTLQSEVEMLATEDYRLATAIRLSGNQLNNSIIGNNGNNVLDGRAGDDSLRGLDGNDLLIGGDGVDYMIGGTGDDIYYVGAGDTVEELVGEGFDAAYSEASYVLSAGASIELLGTLDYQRTDALDLVGNDINQSVIGNNGANTLRGLGGADSINGLDGVDLIDGGAGQDFLTGGGGGDVFRFSAAADSAAGAADTISDFVSGLDRIDLSAIDARPTTGGDDAFTFIGANAFSGAAGELRVQVVAGGAYIYGDLNGDLVPDLEIAISGSAPVLGDFML